MLPKSISDVVFPSIMATFGSAACDSKDKDCNVGAVIEVRMEKPILARSIAPPANSKLVFTRNGRLVLGSSTTKPIRTTWKDRGEKSRDFQCAANWVLSGTTINPEFKSPCSEDVVDFRDVSRL